MLDIKLVRDNPELIKENIKKKFKEDKLHLVDQIRKKDLDWRNQKQRVDKLRHERNSISQEISKVKKEGKNADRLMKTAKLIPAKIEEIEKKADKMQEQIRDLLSQLPNIISNKTPIGKDESQNLEVKKGGVIPKFDFKPKNHVELAESLGIADFDSSARVSGNGFYYLKGDLALLNQALIRFAIEFMQVKGFEYIETPLMLREKQIYASMDKKAIEESVYSIKEEDLHLIGTAEQSLLAMHSNDAMSFNNLPKKYFSYSMCFRKEIGSHGINEKGLWRTHQFNKVEQFVFCLPEQSEKIYEELLKNSEEILQKLKVPYRIIEICSGDLADWKYRSHDLEVWRPTLESYGEVMSLSNCTDYQARKLNIKFIDKNNERQIVHTLNDTALATSRVLVAILENCQQKDGSIKIPDVLQPFMGGKKVIKKN
jgi:seryl-tRNA synthetase